MRGLALPILLATALGGCRATAPSGPIAVSLIGDRAAPTVGGAPREAAGAGLVRLDHAGQLVPDVALRWSILDNGTDYIFRVDTMRGASAARMAKTLRAAILPRAGIDAGRALFANVVSVTAVTDTVIEVRLDAPQPDLLLLLARPEAAVGVAGRFAWRNGRAGAVSLTARDGDATPPVLLRVERAGRAVARFQAGGTQAVLGGSFADLPVARAAALPRRMLRFDPATGLCGLALHDPHGTFATPPLLRALSLAIDRDRLVAAIGAPGLAKATTLAGSAIEPPLPDRVAAARALVNAASATALPVLRVAMPAGPGARLLFALLARDWGRIRVTAIAVAADAPADLILIDRVAPPGSLAVLACAVSAGCDPRDRLALIAPPYIPLAAPVRWSLVARGLDGFTANALAAHPLDQLRMPR